MVLAPDEIQAKLYAEEIAPNSAGNNLFCPVSISVLNRLAPENGRCFMCLKGQVTLYAVFTPKDLVRQHFTPFVADVTGTPRHRNGRV